MIDVLSSFEKSAPVSRRATLPPSTVPKDPLMSWARPDDLAVTGGSGFGKKDDLGFDGLGGDFGGNNLTGNGPLRKGISLGPSVPPRTSSTSFVNAQIRNMPTSENDFVSPLPEYPAPNPTQTSLTIQHQLNNPSRPSVDGTALPRPATRRRDSIVPGVQPQSLPKEVTGPSHPTTISLTSPDKPFLLTSGQTSIPSLLQNLPVPSQQVSLPPDTTKKDLESAQAKLREKDTEITAKDAQINSLQALNARQNAEFQSLKESLEAQTRHQLESQLALHKRELDFHKEAQEKMLAHFREQVAHLQKLLDEKGSENSDLRQRFSRLEGQVRLGIESHRLQEGRRESVNSLTETQAALEAKIGELRAVVCSLEDKERERTLRLEHSEDLIAKKQLEIRRKEAEIGAKETEIKLQAENAKKRLESEKEAMRVETQRILHLESESQAKLAALGERERLLQQAREAFLSQQQTGLETLSKRQEECERLKLEVLRKGEELALRLRTAQEFLTTHEARAAQLCTQESTQAAEVVTFETQRRVLEQKENHLRALEKTVTAERTRIEDLTHKMHLQTVQNELAKKLVDWKDLGKTVTASHELGRLRSLIRQPLATPQTWIGTIRPASTQPLKTAPPSIESRTLLQTLKVAQSAPAPPKFDLEGYLRRLGGKWAPSEV